MTQSVVVFGSNTGVGKTWTSAALIRVLLKQHRRVCYLKPIQTGFPLDSDARFVAEKNQNQNALSAICLLGLPQPISPHIAVRCEAEKSSQWMFKKISSLQGYSLIETAGGVLSPTDGGQLQADFYRPLRLPTLLVGDGKLGGIAATLSAFESLSLRGHNVRAIFFTCNELRNAEFVRERLHQTDPSVDILWINEEADFDRWYGCNESTFESLAEILFNNENKTSSLLSEGGRTVWWPFTQHAAVKKPLWIDSAYNNTFSTDEGELFDASSSWWTNGVGHGHPELALEAAKALGRYGHVLFPECLHEPSVLLARELLATAGKGWAERVFFSDNGSTAVEVALKMAFRMLGEKKGERCYVVGIANSYHGDTLGAMNAASPNVFNAKDDWYDPSGIWFDAPTVAWRDGELCIWNNLDPETFETFESLSSVFNDDRLTSPIFAKYCEIINKKIDEQKNDRAALLIEPLVHGSAGMHFIDPLFQRALIREARRRGMPVIFDEVFAGMWRFGAPSTSVYLNEKPDIACYSKLLTGGTLPLGVTLARDEVFRKFLGDSKASALLHGHSYTAYPAACAVALRALQLYSRDCQLALDGQWDLGVVRRLSIFPSVLRCYCLGSLLVCEFRGDSTAGYVASLGALFAQRLRAHGIHVRPLGNVIYLLVHPLVKKREIDKVTKILVKEIEAFT